MQTSTRQSKAIPGLTLELQISERGVFITFRFGSAFEVFALQDGVAYQIDCSDRYSLTAAQYHHCLVTAGQYAQRFAANRVA